MEREPGGLEGRVCVRNSSFFKKHLYLSLQLFSSGRPTPETMEAFRREVFVMNCLRHPNVVLLLGACQTPPTLAIIMEFVAGGSLHQVPLSHTNFLPFSSQFFLPSHNPLILNALSVSSADPCGQEDAVSDGDCLTGNWHLSRTPVPSLHQHPSQV